MELFTMEPGLIIGLAIIVVATIFLPPRVRWYVITAGVAIVFFRAYQLFWAQKRLKKLDTEREQLRDELSSLRTRNSELEKIHANLVLSLEKIKEERRILSKQREDLDQASTNYGKELDVLDSQLEQKRLESAALVEQGKPILEYLEKFATAERLSANMPAHL